MLLKYLNIFSPDIPELSAVRDVNAASFEIFTDGINLLDQWMGVGADTPLKEIAFISGVLSDWLEENESYLMNSFQGVNPERLGNFIRRLRKICFNTT